MFFTSFLTLQDESWEITTSWLSFLFISSLSALPVTLPWGRCVVVVTITYKLDLQTLPDLTDLWSVTCGELSGPQTGSHSHKQTKHNKVKYYKWGHIIYHTHTCKMFTVHSFLCVGQKKQKQTQETDVNILFNLYEFIYIGVLQLCFGFCSGLFHLLKDTKVWRVKYSIIIYMTFT